VHRTGVVPDIELLASTTRQMGAPAAAAGAQGPEDAAPPRMAKARVDAGRCKALKASDPALSCAVGYLLAGSIDAFVAGLAD
jgi:hypothetical protein